MKVKIKDLKLYLYVRGAPVHLYTEKTELVRLVLMNQHSVSNIGSQTGISLQPGQNPHQGHVESSRSMPGNQSTSTLVARPTPELRTEDRAGAGRRAVLTIPTRERTLIDEAVSRSLPANDSGDIGTSQNDTQGSSAKRPTPTGLGSKIIIADIKSQDQIELLTTRELKQILFDNFIDYKGCVEKIELQTRVHNLYNDKEKAKEDSKRDETEESDLCKICWDETIDCVLLECGHMATCTSCGKRLNECPICRQFIVRCIHVFKS